MATQVDTAQREIVLVEDAHIRPMMGNQVLESLPSRHIPYSLVDPYILVHEADLKIDPNQESQDTTHPHRGFDNLWSAISGSSSTGHSTGPGGEFERARLDEGSLLFIRTGRGVLHAEGIGDDERREGKATEMRGLLFWVNLARKDKNVEPFARVVEPSEVPVRHEGDATIRVLVGAGSPIELGTPGSAPTGSERSAGRLRFSDRAVRWPCRMRNRGRGSCSWPGSHTESGRSTTGRTWTRFVSFGAGVRWSCCAPAPPFHAVDRRRGMWSDQRQVVGFSDEAERHPDGGSQP